MKAKDIKVGRHYTAKVSGNLVTVRVDTINDRYKVGFSGRKETAYHVTNLKTGRKTTFRSAAKFRGEVKAEAGHSDAKKETYSGEQPARICMFHPSGQSWFNSHEAAMEVIRTRYSEAKTVRRWQENGLQYEDYKNGNGDVLVQLEFSGPAVLAAGFTYE